MLAEKTLEIENAHARIAQQALQPTPLSEHGVHKSAQDAG
jgi:hypothetical protein